MKNRRVENPSPTTLTLGEYRRVCQKRAEMQIHEGHENNLKTRKESFVSRERGEERTKSREILKKQRPRYQGGCQHVKIEVNPPIIHTTFQEKEKREREDCHYYSVAR